MAPKTAEKKVAGKAIAQKKGGKKGGKKRSVESWKIYIYKVRGCCPLLLHQSSALCLLLQLLWCAHRRQLAARFMFVDEGIGREHTAVF
jgi:hypothetical protein